MDPPNFCISVYCMECLVKKFLICNNPIVSLCVDPCPYFSKVDFLSSMLSLFLVPFQMEFLSKSLVTCPTFPFTLLQLEIKLGTNLKNILIIKNNYKIRDKPFKNIKARITKHFRTRFQKTLVLVKPRLKN